MKTTFGLHRGRALVCSMMLVCAMLLVVSALLTACDNTAGKITPPPATVISATENAPAVDATPGAAATVYPAPQQPAGQSAATDYPEPPQTPQPVTPEAYPEG
jgi:hypothetical protein